MDICYVSSRVQLLKWTIKMDIKKKKIMGNVVFWNASVVNGMQSENKRPITVEI